MSAPTPGASERQYAELAELAGGFIHEIKNHLGTLSLNLQLLAEDFQNPETQRERRALNRVQRLQSECDRLVTLSSDFMRFARVRAENTKTVDLNPIVEELIDFFQPTAKQARISIKPYLASDLPAVSLDVELFKQALLNLMLNAEQAMPDGGDMTIQTMGDIGSVRLELIDTGPGMSPDVTKNIFKPFYTTKPGGTGLGLPTTRRIIEAHGGQMDVQSELGMGTKFTIWLPAAR